MDKHSAAALSRKIIIYSPLDEVELTEEIDAEILFFRTLDFFNSICIISKFFFPGKPTFHSTFWLIYNILFLLFRFIILKRYCSSFAQKKKQSILFSFFLKKKRQLQALFSAALSKPTNHWIGKRLDCWFIDSTLQLLLVVIT